MRDFNFVITNENYEKNKDLLGSLFGDRDGKIDPPVVEVSPTEDMYDLLVRARVFPSRTIAKKQWTRTGREIPLGFSDLENLGKYHKRITIFNPKP